MHGEFMIDTHRKIIAMGIPVININSDLEYF
jgi:hypothetical protein